MGLSLEEFQSAAGSVGSILTQATNAWATVTGKTQVATPTTQAATPSVASTPNQAINQGSASTTTTSGLAAVPAWAWLAGGIALFMVLGKRR